jgi:CrcB protein
MQNFLWVVLGGGLGAALRHGFSKTAYWLLGKGFPWGTLVANLVGCFLIGFLWATANRFSFPPNARLFIFTGTIGALTTFSTYGLESFMLLHEGRYAAGITNKAMFTIIGAMAELESSLISERAEAGMQAAQEEGTHVGRPPTPDDDPRDRAPGRRNRSVDPQDQEGLQGDPQ